jgi:hypothetical protein
MVTPILMFFPATGDILQVSSKIVVDTVDLRRSPGVKSALVVIAHAFY